MRIGADERVGIRDGLAVHRLRKDHTRQVFDIDLVDDARVGRDDLEVVEGALPPPEEGVALAVPRKLELGVEREGVGTAEVVDLHGVIDHQLHRLQRVDAIGVAAERDDRIAHRGEVDDAGHASEILQEDARRHERDLLLATGGRLPLGERADIAGLDEGVVLAAQQVLEEDLHRVRQARDAAEPRLFERGETVYLHLLATQAEVGARAETVQCSHVIRAEKTIILRSRGRP